MERGPTKGARLWAVPGNHDWYDGLTSFLRVVCRTGWVGGWRTRQTRSYFALRLPHDWWLWAIDIQFDTYLGTGQLAYFAEVGQELGPGHNVLLVTAKPSWVRAAPDVTEPVSWRYLSYLEENYVRAGGARLVHHCRRYAPTDGDGAERITAGGFARMMAVVYVLLAAISLAAAGAGRGSMVATALSLASGRAVTASVRATSSCSTIPNGRSLSLYGRTGSASPSPATAL